MSYASIQKLHLTKYHFLKIYENIFDMMQFILKLKKIKYKMSVLEECSEDER